MPIAARSVDAEVLTRFPALTEAARRFLHQHSDLMRNIASPTTSGASGRRILSPVGETKLRRILSRLLEEREFLAPHGIRALSRWHLEHPFVFNVHGEKYRVDYQRRTTLRAGIGPIRPAARAVQDLEALYLEGLVRAVQRCAQPLPSVLLMRGRMPDVGM